MSSSPLVLFNSNSTIWTNYSQIGLESDKDKENHTHVPKQTLAAAKAVDQQTVDSETKQQIIDFFGQEQNVKRLAMRLFLDLTAKDKHTRKHANKITKALEKLADSLAYNINFPDCNKISEAVLQVSKEVEKLNRVPPNEISKRTSQLPSTELPWDIFRRILMHVDPKELLKIISISKKTSEECFEFSKGIFAEHLANATFCQELGFRSAISWYNYLVADNLCKWENSPRPDPGAQISLPIMEVVPKLNFNKLLKTRNQLLSDISLQEQLLTNETHPQRFNEIGKKIDQLSWKRQDFLSTLLSFSPKAILSQINEQDRQWPSFYLLGFVCFEEIYTHFNPFLAELKVYNSWGIQGPDTYHGTSLGTIQEWNNITSLKAVKSISSPLLGYILNEDLSRLSFLQKLEHLEHIATDLYGHIYAQRVLECLGKLTKLKFLDLWVNELHVVPQWMLHLKNCTTLESLGIYFKQTRYVQIDASVLPQLVGMKCLKELRIQKAEFQRYGGNPFMSLAEITTLKELHLEDCYFNPDHLIEFCKESGTIKVILKDFQTTLTEEQKQDFDRLGIVHLR